MSKKETPVLPINKILSLMPKEDSFLDTRKAAGGAYFSKKHIEIIERALQSASDKKKNFTAK